METAQRFKQGLNLCFSIFKRNFRDSALFQRGTAERFRKNQRKIFHKVMGAGLLVFTNQVQCPFCAQKGLRMEVYCMCEENTSQKERFLQEVEQKLLHRELDARLLEDGLIRIQWNGQPLCSVDRDGIVRFRPADITEPEVDRQLRTVIQTAGHVKEYMRIFERAPALKAIGLDDTYKVLADFGDAVLAGRSCKTGAKFVTWEWDFDRQGVHAGHYFMENYEAAKQDFAVRAGLVERQRLFSDEQLAVIRKACAFALEDDATLSYAEEKQLQSVQEQIELLLPQQTQEQRPTMEQTM